MLAHLSYHGLRMRISKIYGPNTGAGSKVKNTLNLRPIIIWRCKAELVVEGEIEKLVLEI